MRFLGSLGDVDGLALPTGQEERTRNVAGPNETVPPAGHEPVGQPSPVPLDDTQRSADLAMWNVDALQLARIQFGFTIAIHIVFPAVTIGLASYLVVLEGAWLRTRDEVYRSLYLFWSKSFAINFGMGVV